VDRGCGEDLRQLRAEAKNPIGAMPDCCWSFW
jgi:hypothetical protein